MKNLRDRAVSKFDRLTNGQSNAPSLQVLQQGLSGFDSDQIQIIRAAMLKAVDSGIHDFLFALQEESDIGNRVQMVVDGKNIAEISDGLHGELWLFTSFSG